MSPTADPCGSQSRSRGDACLPLLVSSAESAALLRPVQGGRLRSAVPRGNIGAATREQPYGRATDC